MDISIGSEVLHNLALWQGRIVLKRQDSGGYWLDGRIPGWIRVSNRLLAAGQGVPFSGRGGQDSLFHESLLPQPEQTVVCPGMRMRERRLVGESQAVPALLIDVQVKGHMIFSQGFRKHQAVFHGYGLVLVGAPEETRGGI